MAVLMEPIRMVSSVSLLMKKMRGINCWATASFTITDEGLLQLELIRYRQQSDGGITTADRPDQTTEARSRSQLANL